MAEYGQHIEKLMETQPEIKALKAAYDAVSAAFEADKVDIGTAVRMRAAWLAVTNRPPCPCSTCRHRCCDEARP